MEDNARFTHGLGMEAAFNVLSPLLVCVHVWLGSVASGAWDHVAREYLRNVNPTHCFVVTLENVRPPAPLATAFAFDHRFADIKQL